MADNEEPLVKLKIELENVKMLITEIESIKYSSRSVEDKTLLHDYMEKEKRLNAKVDALEGLLQIVSHFTEFCRKKVIKLIHRCC
jgi:hypothetical protein